MYWPELAETLVALVHGLTPPPASGLFVTDADIEVPLEVHSVTAPNGLVFYASVPHSRWIAGVLPSVHLTRLHVALQESDRAE
jgi:hypothetical protein